MASLIRTGRLFRIVFSWIDRKRYTLRLGAVSQRDAALIRHHIESIISAKSNGLPLRDEQIVWLRDLPDGLRDRLRRVHLA